MKKAGIRVSPVGVCGPLAPLRLTPLLTVLFAASTACCSPPPTYVGGYATNRSSLTAEVRRETGPGLIPARRAYLAAGTNTFAFVVPSGFDLAAAAGDKIELVNSDRSCLVTLLLLEPPRAFISEADSEAFRPRIASQYPGAEVAEVFALTAAGRSGPAFDLRWHTDGVTRAARVAYVPSAAGILEFSLIASPDKFAQFLPTLHTVMLTFRASGPDGKLDLPLLSDKL